MARRHVELSSAVQRWDELCAEELVGQVGSWRSGGEWWSDGGRRGAVSNRRGGRFRRRTLEWVVRNIPKKIGTILINGLV